MQINIQKFNEVAKAAKAKTNDKLWRNAIAKAVAGVVSGQWIITELADGIMVTTDSGETSHVNGYCSCRAAELGQPCKHVCLRRLLDLYRAEPEPTKPAPKAPRIVRSIESDDTRIRVHVVRVDGWLV